MNYVECLHLKVTHLLTTPLNTISYIKPKSSPKRVVPLYNLILSILLTFIISNKIKIEEEYLIKKFHNYTLYKNEVKI